MNILGKRSWDFKWTNMGVPGQSNYVAMFSAPHVKTNIIYPYDTLNEVIQSKIETTVPHNVMIEALQSFLQEQVYGAHA